MRRLTLALALVLSAYLSAQPLHAVTTYGVTGLDRTLTKNPSTSLTLCPLVRAIDGDTIAIWLNNRIVTVRLIGVDTPETVHPQKPVQPYGPEAAQFTRTFLEHGPIDIEPDALNPGPDRYGRALAYVYRHRDRACLNDALIAAGLAHVETRWRFQRETHYLKLEQTARAQGRGIWSLPATQH